MLTSVTCKCGSLAGIFVVLSALVGENHARLLEMQPNALDLTANIFESGPMPTP